MEKFRNALSKLPSWLLTILTTLLILWLTLAPDPLGDDSPTLFPGADKVVHALMFGFLTVMLLLDKERRNGWHKLGNRFIWLSAVSSSLFGIVIEFLQLAMAMGRGFEYTDMVADITGSVICAYGWSLFQKCWSR